MNDKMTLDTLGVILEIAKSMKHQEGRMLNERYLHHFFSHKLQEKHNLIDLLENNEKIALHPEWPTFKNQTNLEFGKYRYNKNKIYEPNKEGTAGFIDFAVGDYKKPYTGIEFILKHAWSNEEAVFDYLKLLDKRNPFQVSISFNVILRENKLVDGKRLDNFIKHLNKSCEDAINRLNSDICDNSRELYFIVTEIDRDNNRRHWHYNGVMNYFEKDLPAIR